MSSNPHRLKVVVPLAKSPPVSSSFVPFLLLLVPLVPRGRTTSVYLATKAPGSSPRYTFCIKISTEAPTSARLATLPLATRHHSSHRASRHHSFRHHSSRCLVRCGVQRCSAVFSGVQIIYSAVFSPETLRAPRRPSAPPPHPSAPPPDPPRPSETLRDLCPLRGTTSASRDRAASRYISTRFPFAPAWTPHPRACVPCIFVVVVNGSRKAKRTLERESDVRSQSSCLTPLRFAHLSYAHTKHESTRHTGWGG